MIAPILQEIAEELGEKIKIGKLDVDENHLISANFSIDAIPALILFKEGKVMQRFVGVQPKEIIKEAIDSIIDKK